MNNARRGADELEVIRQQANAAEVLRKADAREPKPDALTRLEGVVRRHVTSETVALMLNGLISDARKEMEAKQRVVDTLSTKMGDSHSQGQQQGRVELAQELLAMTLTERDHHLNDIVAEDAGQ